MVKCLTLNAHSWVESLPLKRLFDIAEHIIEANYDIICLQEVNQRMDSKVAKQVGDLCVLSDFPAVHEDNFALNLVRYLEIRGQHYYWSWAYNHIAYDNYNEGVALLSKTSFEAQDILVSKKHDEFDYHTRHVLLAKTVIDDKPITLASLHLSWQGKGFETEWHHLEQVLSDYPEPYILMGDFNVPTDSSGYRLICQSSLQLQDCHHVARTLRGHYTIESEIDGWSGNEEQLKVDHIFVSQSINVEASEVLFDGGLSPIVSDHFGIAVTLSVS